ncbi:MAG: hypothetical protein ISP01_00525 [Methanobrevibacter arboriphilus]|uniref:Uncharacterized protein n=1 Tax=Methanobrevibacter arboriphilus TaxID=39441 RepID=A0A843AFM7_METAZ|nr:hypothetical protein [Methanobrevibacter arboriphilus]MBF4467865.1 hypothetical protein [Methanobrevibacter arboriphilus]
MSIEEELEGYISKYYLEENADEECPGCGGKLQYYTSKYDNEVLISYCSCCGIKEHNLTFKDNVCEICGELVRYEDEDKDNYIICSHPGCDGKIHKECSEDIVCDKCRIWACQEHEKEYIICDTCGLLHSENCIEEIEWGPPYSIEKVCLTCLNRNNDLIEEIKRPFLKKHEQILEEIDETSDYYVKEAKENFDLSNMVTHLIKNDNPYETLKKILREKKLKANVTGYYNHLKSTESVCFTDLSVRGLGRHAQNYSPYGIAFMKRLIYESDGGPALYIRENLLREREDCGNINHFVNKVNIQRNFDFHHEREWRIPHDFEFDYEEISIVYAPTKHHKELVNEFPDLINILDLDFLQLI